ncbi:MAG: hypothetical protein ACOVO1_05780 [Chitinophagaceae bacterium]
MKSTIFNNWNFFRILRLILGIIIIVQSIYSKDWQISIIGLLFTGLAVFNIGCCGAGGCYTSSKSSQNNNKEIKYEEVV